MKNKPKFEKTKAFCALLSEGRKGGEALLYCLAVLLFAGGIHSLYGFLPLWLLLIASVVLSAASALLIWLIFFLLFGTKRLVRALFYVDAFMMIALLISGCQGGQIPFNVCFGLLFVIAVDLLGRSFFAFVIALKRKQSLVITAVSAFLILSASLLFLIPDGFAQGNTERYLAMQEKNEEPEGFAPLWKSLAR